MILSKHLRELLGFRTPGNAVVSLTLDLDAAGSPPRRFQALREALGPGRIPPELQDDLRRIETFLASELDPAGARGLALYSARRFGLWRVCLLPQPCYPRLSFSDRPAVGPLVAQTDQYQRYGVVLLSSGRARFLESFMGSVREHEDRSVRSGASRDALLKEAAAGLDSLARAHGFDRVVVAGHEDLERGFVDRIRPALQDNLIVDRELKASSSIEEVAQRIGDADKEARKVRESVLAHRLIDEAQRGAGAVLGLARTLLSLEAGSLKTLYLRDGFAKMGRACPNCKRLSLSENKCIRCARSTTAVFNVVEEMAQRVLDLQGEVFRFLNPTLLDNVGRIGAVLRREPDAPAAPNADANAAGVLPAQAPAAAAAR